MDEYKRNGDVPEHVSKRDKKRHAVAARLGKLEASFAEERHGFYRHMLHQLQSTLATVQQGTNAEYVQRKARLEQRRDLELTRLSLYEAYQVQRAQQEYAAEVQRARENHDTLVRLLKEKFDDKVQRQMRQAKEDKLLLNLVNASSWGLQSGQDAQTLAALSAAAAAQQLNLKDRRLSRKRELFSRFTAGEADDLSDSGLGSKGYVSASKRRRHYATRYSLNDELGTHDKMKPLAGSGNDSNLLDKDYDELNALIMNDDGELLLLHRRPNTRSKQFVGVQGLKAEELLEDLLVLESRR